jgi:hypothetical protein
MNKAHDTEIASLRSQMEEQAMTSGMEILALQEKVKNLEEVMAELRAAPPAPAPVEVYRISS